MPILKIKEVGSPWDSAVTYDLGDRNVVAQVAEWSRLPLYLRSMTPVEALEAVVSYLSRGHEDAAIQWSSKDEGARAAEAQAVAELVQSLSSEAQS